MTYREGRRNDKDTHRVISHTCDFSDSVEDLQFLWIKSTDIIVTVSVEDRKVQKGHHFWTACDAYCCIWVTFGQVDFYKIKWFNSFHTPVSLICPRVGKKQELSHLCHEHFNHHCLKCWWCQISPSNSRYKEMQAALNLSAVYEAVDVLRVYGLSRRRTSANTCCAKRENRENTQRWTWRRLCLFVNKQWSTF